MNALFLFPCLIISTCHQQPKITWQSRAEMTKNMFMASILIGKPSTHDAVA